MAAAVAWLVTTVAPVAAQSPARVVRCGDRVLVDGTLSSDRRHVIARDIWRDDSRAGWTQAP